MPLTALHATAGVLDATQPELGAGISWADVHHVKLSPPLTCRGCDGVVHAKVSVRELRFFAHRKRIESCPSNGETMQHRLLKTELAAAIRAAGWVAELEVAGCGWRADVLAIRPDGQRRIAWEAQLASATADDLRQRTATMLRELDGVCWVTDRDAAWLGKVPSARVQRPDTPPEPALAAGPGGQGQHLQVIEGPARFQADWCRNRRRCRNTGPCAGHGTWSTPPNVTLKAFVSWVCAQRVESHRTRSPLYRPPSRHDEYVARGHHVWAPRSYICLEGEADRAAADRAAWHEEQDLEAEKRRKNIEALLARQRALLPETLRLAHQTAEDYETAGQASPEWAMGVPVYVRGEPWAVISPVASRITGSIARNLSQLLIVVASFREQERIAERCWAQQRFELIALATD